jgi:hypothetical protein
MLYNRITIIVLDSVGVGALPDADKYGDAGPNTLGNLARELGGLDLPNLQALGLGNITDIEGVPSSWISALASATGRPTPSSARATNRPRLRIRTIGKKTSDRCGVTTTSKPNWIPPGLIPAGAGSSPRE